ncbi:MAG: D-aminoacyl-tRNA deacylase [Chloroflexota bacterium]|nr:D-aminoacyl-tRNA deacylase [Chloroflexota bacterium]
MRAVLQAVSQATVSVDGVIESQVDQALLVYLGISETDTDELLAKFGVKVANLRVFPDESDRLMYSCLDLEASILLIPNFTLISDARKGRRPTFFKAAEPAVAEALFNGLVNSLVLLTPTLKTGVFGADMTVEATVRGPLNLVIDDQDLM